MILLDSKLFSRIVRNMKITTKLLLLFVILIGSIGFIGCGKAKTTEPKKRKFPIKLLPVKTHKICIKYAEDVDILNMKDVFTISTENVQDWPIACFAMQKDIVLNSVVVNKVRQDVFIVDRYLKGDFPEYVPVEIVDHIKENANIFQVRLTDEMKEADELQFIIHYSLYSQPPTEIFIDNKGEFTLKTLEYWFPTSINPEEVVEFSMILPEDYDFYWNDDIQTPTSDEYFKVFNLTIDNPDTPCYFKGIKR